MTYEIEKIERVISSETGGRLVVTVQVHGQSGVKPTELEDLDYAVSELRDRIKYSPVSDVTLLLARNHGFFMAVEQIATWLKDGLLPLSDVGHPALLEAREAAETRAKQEERATIVQQLRDAGFTTTADLVETGGLAEDENGDS